MKLGLIGKTLSHSFSQKYFNAKFLQLSLGGYSYHNIELESIDLFPKWRAQNPLYQGLNVTIPYKKSILPFLDALSKEAKEIQAVNTIASKNGKLIGHNTDWIGFTESLRPLLKPWHREALILGNGGAAKAVAYSLKKLGISFSICSRQPATNCLSYAEANERLNGTFLVINTTPLGSFPQLNEMPAVNTEKLSKKHLIYDLIYNPSETLLLQKAKLAGAQIKNGEQMLLIQAERAFEIWNE